jgi:hypothetical protein
MGQRPSVIIQAESIGIDDEDQNMSCFDKLRGTILCCYQTSESETEETEYLYSVTHLRRERISSVNIPHKPKYTLQAKPSVGALFDEEGRKQNFLGPKASDWMSSYNSFKQSPIKKSDQ